MKSPTLQDIADEARLSRSTVSMILNGRGDHVGIKPATQRLVQDLARRMNYRVNHLARGLAGKATRTIGIIWSFSGYHPHQMIRRELMHCFDRHGYRSYIADTLSEWGKLEDELDDLVRRGVDGVVLSLPHEMLLARVKPNHARITSLLNAVKAKVIVLHHTEVKVDLPGAVLYRSEEQAIQSAISHLVGQGRRRLAILTNAKSNRHKIACVQGHVASQFGMDPHGVAIHDILVNRPEEPWDPIALTLRELADTPVDWTRYDAVFCTADEVAMALMAHLRQCGVRCPDDVAVVGYNNSPFCQATDPPMASIEWHNTRTVKTIERLLFDQMAESADAQAGQMSQVIPLEFIWRASAGGDSLRTIEAAGT